MLNIKLNVKTLAYISGRTQEQAHSIVVIMNPIAITLIAASLCACSWANESNVLMKSSSIGGSNESRVPESSSTGGTNGSNVLMKSSSSVTTGGNNIWAVLVAGSKNWVNYRHQVVSELWSYRVRDKIREFVPIS